MKNAIIMTIKGQQNLTNQCLEGLYRTAGEEFGLVIVDAGVGSEKFEAVSTPNTFYEHKPGCGISAGWNIGMEIAEKLYDPEYVWLLNNDVIFHRPGWFQKLITKLDSPNLSLVGTYAMYMEEVKSTFVTGGIWGFKLKVAKEIAENGKILDENTNLSCQDVDLSVRIRKAGYDFNCVEGVEKFGSGPEGPMITHLISATQNAQATQDVIMGRRAEEIAYLVRKHGKHE